MAGEEAADTMIKTVTAEARDPQSGKLLRTTRRIRMRLVAEHVSPAVAARLSLPRFGDAAPNTSTGNDEANGRCTIPSDAVFLRLALPGAARDTDAEQAAAKAPAVEVKAVECRHCLGAHWSARCPFKATFADDAEPAAGASSSKARVEQLAAGGAVSAEGAAGRYVPPAMRARMDAAAAAGTPVSALQPLTQRDNPNTVRLANLPTNCAESDLRDLCGRIAPVMRAYVVKDARTGQCRGSAFVSFSSMMEAERVVGVLHGRPYGNLIMTAEIAKPQAP